MLHNYKYFLQSYLVSLLVYLYVNTPNMFSKLNKNKLRTT